MANLLDVFGRLLLEDGGRGFVKQSAKAGDAAGAAVGKGLTGGIKKSLSGVDVKGALLQGIGLGGGLAAANLLGDAVGGVADLIGTSIEAASDLNETVTKSEQIFGDHADEVEHWAEGMDTAFGQSKRAALDTASTFAGLFDTVGFAEDEAADKAIKLTELGSDLASFFNTDVAEAAQALRSGLAGESEPLRRFNVFLSETAVNAKLVEQGQKKVNGQWTEAQKIGARYQIILEQTSAAQGDFARTADGLANQQRILNAERENAQAALGQELLPLELDWIQLQRDAIPLLTDVARGAHDVGVSLDFWSGKLNDLLDQLTPWDGTTHEVTRTAKSYRDELARVSAETAHLGDMANRSKDDLYVAADGFDHLADSADDASSSVRISASEILESIAALRQGAVSDAQAAADALYDPIIKAAELAETQAELAEQRRIISAKESTDEQVAEATRRREELGKQLLVQQGELLTYGTRAEQISKTSAFLASSFWEEAYREATPEQRAALDEWRRTLEERLDSMTEDARAGGEGVVDTYTGEIKSGRDDVFTATGAMVGGSNQAFKDAQAAARGYGASTSAAYAAGLRASVGLVSDAVATIAWQVTKGLKASSPPVVTSPLHHIGDWARSTVLEYAKQFRGEAGAVRSAAMDVANAAASGLRPATPGFAAPGMAGVAAGAGARAVAPTYVRETHLHVEAPTKARDPLAIVQAHERFERVGYYDWGQMRREAEE